MSDTPRTDAEAKREREAQDAFDLLRGELAATKALLPQTLHAARGGIITDWWCVAMKLRKELAAERKRAVEAERDAKRWKQALMFIGADVDRSGEQCFVIRMPLFRQVNLMRGSVSEHFTKRIDEAMRNG